MIEKIILEINTITLPELETNKNNYNDKYYIKYYIFNSFMVNKKN